MYCMDELRKSEALPDTGGIGDQLREISTLSNRFQKHVGRSLSVNDTDLSAMEHLMTEGPLSPSDLARRLDISTAATTVVVDRLAALGHVHREPHAHDRRKVVVVPSPASVQAAFETLIPMLAGISGVASRLSEGDRATVERFLADVIAVYSAAIPARD